MELLAKSPSMSKNLFFNFYCRYEITRDYTGKHIPYRLTLNNSACGDAEKVIITSGIVRAAIQKSIYEKKLVFQFLM
jgi:hypothetical protein